MCDMPRYDLTVSQILSIISYLELLRANLRHGEDTIVSQDMMSEIDSLIEALKSIKL